jgi:hypothetical protein
MKKTGETLTRRDFIKGAGCAAMGLAVGLPAIADELTEQPTRSRVILIRDRDVVGEDGGINGEIIRRMMDEAMKALFDKDDLIDCWKEVIKPDDVVGIKSNEWGPLPTPAALEQLIRTRVMDAGVPGKNISIGDRGILHDDIFLNATALINARPLRTHAWSGVGGLIKNQIMFVKKPWDYHADSCAGLGALWHLPLVKGKTRLNVLVMLTPLFYGRGRHHFDPTYTWSYKGLLVGTDPVALDTIGLQIFAAQRKAYFGRERPIRPPAHHVVIADRKYHLGTSDPGRIDLIKLGWQEDILI